jgi:hypothetical protein
MTIYCKKHDIANCEKCFGIQKEQVLDTKLFNECKTTAPRTKKIGGTWQSVYGIVIK